MIEQGTQEQLSQLDNIMEAGHFPGVTLDVELEAQESDEIVLDDEWNLELQELKATAATFRSLVTMSDALGVLLATREKLGTA